MDQRELDLAISTRLEIRTSLAKAPAGSYAIKINEVRTATEKDKHYVTAWKLVQTASQLEKQQTADSVRKAVGYIRKRFPSGV